MTQWINDLLVRLPPEGRAHFPTFADALAQANIEIIGITDDSRQVQPGFVFVAYRGVASDGHKYISQAIQKGATVVVCEEVPDSAKDLPARILITQNGRAAFAWLCAAWQGFPSRAMTVIGITGTDGKTSTSNILFNILKAAGKKTGMISTVNAVIGERTLDTGLHTTTPDADEIQAYLAQMRDAGMTHCVLEVTSHGLAQHRVDGCTFDLAVITNITHEHLDLHGTREAYRAAKGRLFDMAQQHVVLNADDEYSFGYLKNIAHAPITTYSRVAGTSADVTATDVQFLPDAMAFVAHTPIGPIAIRSALIGDFNVSNLLAATAAALRMGISADVIATGIAQLKGVPGRMERIIAGQPFLAVVDFAHTANSLENCLRTLRRITTGKLIVVFGCAGERDVAKRPIMGRIAAEQADLVVITAEDPRRESLDAIMDAVEAGARAAHSHAEINRIADRGEAIQHACRLAQPGDTVVACGKGHEQSMCFGTTEYPWDDRVAMRDACLAIPRNRSS